MNNTAVANRCQGPICVAGQSDRARPAFCSRRCGDRTASARHTTCVSSWPAFAARSKSIPPSRVTCSQSQASATDWRPNEPRAENPRQSVRSCHTDDRLEIDQALFIRLGGPVAFLRERDLSQRQALSELALLTIRMGRLRNLETVARRARFSAVLVQDCRKSVGVTGFEPATSWSRTIRNPFRRRAVHVEQTRRFSAFS
jgi:hypothetical protein